MVGQILFLGYYIKNIDLIIIRVTVCLTFSEIVLFYTLYLSPMIQVRGNHRFFNNSVIFVRDPLWILPAVFGCQPLFILFFAESWTLTTKSLIPSCFWMNGNKGDIMNIKENIYVAFDYRLTLDSGEEVDKSPAGQPLGFITGAGQIIPGLEKEMMGMTEGDGVKISVEPENAYGLVNPELFQDINKDQFPSDMEIKPGMAFQSQGPQGKMIINVKEIKDENTVVIDLNHPLAGKRLHFDVNIAEVREITSEEAENLSSESGCDCGCDCSTEQQTNCNSDGCDSESGCC